MVADIGTRRGATINDIAPGSSWDVGLPWMTKDVSEFPTNKYNEIEPSHDE